MKITIEKFKKKYLNDIQTLILDIQTKEFNIPISLYDQPDLLDIHSFHQENSSNFWIARDRDQVIGSIALYDIGCQQAALRKFFVHPDFRGNMGTAKKLLDTLINWARKQNLREIYLGTNRKFLAAHRFYEKNGFIEIPSFKLPENFPVVQLDDIFYCFR